VIFLQIDGDADEDEIFSHLATIFDNKFVSSDLGIVHSLYKVENIVSLDISVVKIVW